MSDAERLPQVRHQPAVLSSDELAALRDRYRAPVIPSVETVFADVEALLTYIDAFERVDLSPEQVATAIAALGTEVKSGEVWRRGRVRSHHYPISEITGTLASDATLLYPTIVLRGAAKGSKGPFPVRSNPWRGATLDLFYVRRFGLRVVRWYEES